jgi:glycosyltransferase involved in cell wall biosynthesis
MRVVIDARGTSGRLTGAGKALDHLLRRLRADFPAHEYLACDPAGAASWRFSRQLVWEQIALPLHARRLGADVLHLPGGTPGPLVSPTPVVMTVHDLAPTRHPELLPHARSRWYWGRLVPWTARRAHAVLVPSMATKRDVVTLAGVPEARVHVTPWGVPLDVDGARGAPTPAEVRSTYGLPDVYALYVGTIDRRKDYRTLLEALRRLDPRVHLVVAGTLIAGRTDFPETVAGLGLDRRVRALGYVPERELPALYRGAAVFVYPSFHEGFGLPVLEAMACGTPVVTYRTASLPEVAGDAALLLDLPVTPETLASALTRVMRDEALRRRLTERGLARAATFDWRRTAALTVRVYETLPTRRPSGGA